MWGGGRPTPAELQERRTLPPWLPAPCLLDSPSSWWGRRQGWPPQAPGRREGGVRVLGGSVPSSKYPELEPRVGGPHWNWGPCLKELVKTGG